MLSRMAANQRGAHVLSSRVLLPGTILAAYPLVNLVSSGRVESTCGTCYCSLSNSFE